MRRFFSIFTLILTFSLLSSVGALTSRAATTGPSGAPLPRYVSLHAEKAYMRTGPGRQYPIEWVYTLKGLPFEVVDEDGPWRQVKDIDGATGWIHVTLLTGHRTAMITGRMHKLYEEPDTRSALRLTADPGVIGDLLACQGIWCQLEIDGTKAWTERKNLWGVFPREEFK